MPPRSAAVGVKDLLLYICLLPLVGALQQRPYHNAYLSKAQSDELSQQAASAASRFTPAGGDSLHTAVSGLHRHRDTHAQKQKQRTRSSTDVSALATQFTAESNPAVRAPPAQRSSATGGLASRQQARSLQDWRVEDIVLLATVDGKIHAHDRHSGAPKWSLDTEKPMVETIYHAHNKSLDENGLELDDPLWIVEPSQDGGIYIYTPGSGVGIEKLWFTVRQLVDQSPLAGEGPPAVTYTAEKKSTMYTIDAATGHILKTFSTVGSTVNADRSCKRVNPFESLDEKECEPIGTLTFGRSEYTVGVSDWHTGEQISTIRYSEWVPNNNDQDLQEQYSTAMDGKYVYTKHDGHIFGFDAYKPGSGGQAHYWKKLSSPVARVFDLVRRRDDTSGDASLVVLPQPIRPPLESQDGNDKRIFVDSTSDGSFYALSESNYPTVTEDAAPALWSGLEFLTKPGFTWPLSERQREKFTGVHQVAHPVEKFFGGSRIDAPGRPGIDPPPEEHSKGITETTPSIWSNIPPLRSILMLVILGLVACGVLYRQQAPPANKVAVGQVDETALPESKPSTLQEPAEEKTPMVRESEPAQETIFPHEADGSKDGPGEAQQADEDFEKIEFNETLDADDPKDANDVKPRKKATRGKRGGKKQKEKEQEKAEARAKRTNSQGQEATEVITVAASESPQVSGPLQINSLLIHTDKIIGQGSCGTSVFEGSFEGREVAVKRMLSQYYELASQEVSFLQQSDDHPNVIRYFCQQKDEHFLYIAVELCQASLFEVWETEKAKTEERQMQLRSLKHTIQQDVPKALHQLAAGLYHLHNLRIIHRDIKPQNILVAFAKRHERNGPRLVISDFGLGKNLPENVSTLVDPTGNAGTSGWKAPELISQPRESESKHSQSNSHTGGSENANGTTSGVKRAADIFSLGCLFFWVLTDGIHPYEDENGWQQLRELNIKRDNKKMDVLQRWSDAYEPMQLIAWMLEHQPEDRPTAIQVLNHPFFWPSEKRLSFLCDCSDHFEREPRGTIDDSYTRDSAHLKLLESKAEEVIGAPFDRADFLAKLDRHFVDTLGKQRKYSGNRLLDLLRAFRNKKNHYEDMPEDVKKRVGPLPGGYLSYWANRFPRLLMACYQVVREANLQNNDRFKGYFTLEKA